MADDNRESAEEMVWEEIQNWDRGIFTKQDRAYLLSQRDLEGQDERNTRYRIRQRIISALRDIKLLTHVVDDDDFSQVVNSEEMTHLLASEGHPPFLLKYMAELMLSVAEDSQEIIDPISTVENSVEWALRSYTRKTTKAPSGATVDASVSIEAEYTKVDLEEIKKLYSNVAEEEMIEEILPPLEHINMTHEELVEEVKEYYREHRED